MRVKVGSILFGLIVMSIGLVFCVLLFNGYLKAKKTYTWAQKECLILSSVIHKEQYSQNAVPSYSLQVSYQYVVDGKKYTSQKIKPRKATSKNRKKIENKKKSMAAGKYLICYVNLENPSEAVLEHDTKAPLYTMWFPGLFVVGGMGIVWNAFRKDEGERRGSVVNFARAVVLSVLLRISLYSSNCS